MGAGARMASAKSRELTEACQANHWECMAACLPATAAVFSGCRPGVCLSNAMLLRQTIHRHLRRARLQKILTVFQRIRLRFLRARAAHLPASPSPRNEGLLGQTPRGSVRHCVGELVSQWRGV